MGEGSHLVTNLVRRRIFRRQNRRRRKLYKTENPDLRLIFSLEKVREYFVQSPPTNGRNYFELCTSEETKGIY